MDLLISSQNALIELFKFADEVAWINFQFQGSLLLEICQILTRWAQLIICLIAVMLLGLV